MLVIKDSPTNEDYNIVKQYKLLKKYADSNLEPKLYIIRSFFDQYDRGENFEEAKKNLKKKKRIG